MEGLQASNTGHTADLPRTITTTTGALESGHRATCDPDSKHLPFVLVILGLIGLVIASAGAIGVCGGISTLSHIHSILMLTGGLAESLLCVALYVLCCRSVEKTAHYHTTTLLGSNNPATNKIVLENTEGKKVTTTLAELYGIAADTAPSKDREAFLTEVKGRLDSKEFQDNPLLYIEKWLMIRAKNTPVQQQAMEFFCDLIRDIDNPEFPWNLKS